MNRYLRPAIGIVATLALGVGGTLLGIHFAAPEVITAPATQVEAPVLAPIAPGDETAISQQTGTRTITNVGTTPTGVPADLADLITEVSSADDPSLAVTEYRDEEAGAAAGDPCSPTDGTAPADCPDGLHSAIFALDAVRNQWVDAVAFPQNQAEYQATSHYTLYPWCPATAHTDTQAPLGLIASVPADFTVTYWPSADPSDRHTATATSSPEDRALYDSQTAGGIGPWDRVTPRTCILLDHLEPNTVYSVTVNSIDRFGPDASPRIATPKQLTFNSAGELSIPEPEITTLGDNLVFVHALHTAGERVVIRGILAPIGHDAPDCDAVETGGLTVGESETTVSDEYLLEHDYLPEYSKRANKTFLLPEGATFVVCVRYYPQGDDVPSWETAQPDKQSRVVILAPDFVRPIVTLTNNGSQRGSRVSVAVATVEGIKCGGDFDTNVPGHNAVPYSLCEPGRVTGTVVLADELRNYGYDGQLAVVTKLAPQGGGETVKDSLLDIGLQPCIVHCPTPAELDYRLLLGPSGSTETVTLHVSWEQGRTNGTSEWVIPPIETTAPDYVRPDEPDFDHDAALDDFQIDWEAKNQGLTYMFHADRAVDYTVTLGGQIPDASLPCLDGASPVATRSGHTDGLAPVRLDFYGLCMGEVYNLEVTLTDDTGRTVSYGSNWRDTHYMVLQALSPGWDGSMVWSVDSTGPVNSQLHNFGLSVAGVRVTDAPEDICSADGVIHYTGTTDITLSQNNLVAVGGWWTTPDTFSTTSCVNGHLIAHDHIQLWEVVSMDDIQWGASSQGVWLHADDFHGTAVHLWMDDFR